jgi:hypothetical protein
MRLLSQNFRSLCIAETFVHNSFDHIGETLKHELHSEFGVVVCLSYGRFSLDRRLKHRQFRYSLPLHSAILEMVSADKREVASSRAVA